MVKSTTLEHIGRSVLGLRYSRENLFAMLTCYFDEAGGDDHHFMVVAGYVASVEQWERFESDWKIVLARYDVPYLHMKEFAHFKGPFTKWKSQPGTRARFLNSAADVINSTVRLGVSVYIHYKAFENVNREYDLTSLVSSPYALAGRSCIAEANVASRHGARGPIDMEYVFERGGPDVGGLIKSVTIQTPTLPIPIFKPSRDTESERGLIQLQAADYLAYEIAKYV